VAEQNKRWVVIEPPGAAGSGAKLLLARGVSEAQTSRIGNQTGGRVFLFLYTDDFWRDFNAFKAKGIEFAREPSEAPYGTVALCDTRASAPAGPRLLSRGRRAFREIREHPARVAIGQDGLQHRPIGQIAVEHGHDPSELTRL